MNIQFPDVFKFLYKRNPLIWSHSSCINHAHNGQRKLVTTLTSELFSLYKFENVKQKKSSVLFSFGGGFSCVRSPPFLLPYYTAVCHLFSIPKEVIGSGPLLWVTSAVRAVCQLSLDFPSPPHQTKINLRKDILERVES